jgi:hypothetical protein
MKTRKQKYTVEVHVQYVPLPPERIYAWKQAIRLLLNLIRDSMNTENGPIDRIEETERGKIES